MYSEDLLVPMSRWYHPATDSYYTIQCVACDRLPEWPSSPLANVIYWSDVQKRYSFMEKSEFLNGQFIPLGPNGGPLPIGEAF